MLYWSVILAPLIAVVAAISAVVSSIPSKFGGKKTNKPNPLKGTPPYQMIDILKGRLWSSYIRCMVPLCNTIFNYYNSLFIASQLDIVYQCVANCYHFGSNDPESYIGDEYELKINPYYDLYEDIPNLPTSGVLKLQPIDNNFLLDSIQTEFNKELGDYYKELYQPPLVEKRINLDYNNYAIFSSFYSRSTDQTVQHLLCKNLEFYSRYLINKNTFSKWQHSKNSVQSFVIDYGDLDLKNLGNKDVPEISFGDTYNVIVINNNINGLPEESTIRLGYTYLLTMNHFGLVYQNIQVFEGTIKSNSINYSRVGNIQGKSIIWSMWR